MTPLSRSRLAFSVAGIVAVAAAGCATTGPTITHCYPHMFLDNRYQLHGTYSGSGSAAVDQDNCYRFTYRDGRLTQVD